MMDGACPICESRGVVRFSAGLHELVSCCAEAERVSYFVSDDEFDQAVPSGRRAAAELPRADRWSTLREVPVTAAGP